MFKKAFIAASAASLLAIPGAASAQYYPDPYYGGGGYNGQATYGSQRCSGTTGTVVGGVAGAVVGSRIARGRQSYDYYGNRSGGGNATTGALIGGAVGALLGRKVDKSACKRRNRNNDYGYRY